MAIFRKSPLIILVFSGIWLLISLPYTIGAECSCCNHNEFKCICNEKTNHQNYCLDLKSPSKNCQCHCISCGDSNYNDFLPEKEYINTSGKDQLPFSKQVSSDGYYFLVDQNVINYQNNEFPVKYLSLFLVNASFLL